ncbi:hypothetical protein Pst134EB_029710, partial [Puccinia striiformis f. sp. tritici]
NLSGLIILSKQPLSGDFLHTLTLNYLMILLITLLHSGVRSQGEDTHPDHSAEISHHPLYSVTTSKKSSSDKIRRLYCSHSKPTKSMFAENKPGSHEQLSFIFFYNPPSSL